MITIHVRKDSATLIPVQAIDMADAAHRCRKAMEQGLAVEQVLDADGVEIAMPIEAAVDPLPTAEGDIAPVMTQAEDAGAAEAAKALQEAPTLSE